MATSRIGGDYNAEALEAFRAAYANQMQTPEDLDIAPNGLPGSEISNTSPWVMHTGLWKANDGMSRDFVPNQPFNADSYIKQDEEYEEESEEDEEPLTEDEIDAYLDSLSVEELSSLMAQLEEEALDTSGEMSEEEIDNLIEEITAEG
jgi:hypothetical protein